MIWTRLKNLKCPKCNDILKGGEKKFHCSNSECTFWINKNKFDSIVESIYQGKKPLVEEDNFKELQNLGHEEELSK